MLTQNAALTHLDVSHNRVNPDGCKALAEGIAGNHNLLSLEVGFNPMGVSMDRPDKTVPLGLQPDQTGIEELIKALRNSEKIEQVGLSNVQSGGSYARGRASRFDPKNPDGHYALDLMQPWDRFIAETLHERMVNEKGESWINVGLNGKGEKGRGNLERANGVGQEGGWVGDECACLCGGEREGRTKTGTRGCVRGERDLARGPCAGSYVDVVLLC